MQAWLDPQWYFSSPGQVLSSGNCASHAEAGDALTDHDPRGMHAILEAFPDIRDHARAASVASSPRSLAPGPSGWP
jgi:hypothetical protein